MHISQLTAVLSVIRKGYR